MVEVSIFLTSVAQKVDKSLSSGELCIIKTNGVIHLSSDLSSR